MMRQAIKQWLHSHNWSYSPLPTAIAEDPQLLLRPKLREIAAGCFGEIAPSWTFVQIGAFDGKAHDDLGELVKHYSWRGLFIEPQATAMSRLKVLYESDPNVSFAQVAVGERDGITTMFTVAGQEDSPITSFDADHVRRHLHNGGLADSVQEIEVSVRQLDGLLREHGIQDPDVVQVDAEGYDYEIVMGLSFSRIQPRIIRYEHSHLSREKQEKLVSQLADHGYRFVFDNPDTIAVKIVEDRQSV